MLSLNSEHQLPRSSSSTSTVTNTDIELSIGVAVYNVKTYLRECLDSLCKQTFKNTEFIVVDDGSTDGSSAICDEYAKKDSRFKIIHHGVNKGSLLARKTAITSAKGKYMSFMDGDDYYTTPESLTSMYELISKNDVDVLRYEAECVGDEKNNTLHSARESVKHKLPQNKRLDPFYVLNKLFSSTKGAWNIWLSVYKTDVLKKVAQESPDEYLVSAEDVFILFLIIYHAKSYMEVESGNIYSYRVGPGISTCKVSLQKFSEYAKEVRIVPWLNQILTKDECSDEYFNITAALLKLLISGTVSRLKKLPASQQKEASDFLVAECRTLQMVMALSEVYCEYSNQDYKLIKVIRYAIKGKLSFSRKKRTYYRNKLKKIFIRLDSSN